MKTVHDLKRECSSGCLLKTLPLIVNSPTDLIEVLCCRYTALLNIKQYFIMNFSFFFNVNRIKGVGISSWLMWYLCAGCIFIALAGQQFTQPITR